MIFGFKNKVAVVTGGASGIGEGIARRLAAEGARVFVADLNKGGAAKLEKDFAGLISFVQHDISSDESWNRLLTEVDSSAGAMDLLVNCAAVCETADIETTTPESFDRAMSVNARGTFLGCQHAVRHWAKTNKQGVIVNVASTAAVKTASWVLAYGASKAAVVSMTRSIALHCAQSRLPIRCNAVLPGVVMTPMVSNVINQSPDRELAIAGLAAAQPIGRMIEIEEVVNAVLFLGSDASSGITGTTLAVDGGTTAG